MQKLRTLLKAPLLTQSGYGVHSRQIFDALMADPLFDVAVESINWGHCSFITEQTEQRKQINEAVNKAMFYKQQKQEDYDLFIHITIPNEFERRGKLNVGVTAGIETDRVSHVWVQKCNEMDMIIVPSEHSKHVLTSTVIEWQNQKDGSQGNFQVSKPVLVCPEGVDTNVFKKKEYENKLGLDIQSDFNFLHVGQWGGGNFGEDRKNISLMLKYFIETFRYRKDVGMVLKTNMAKNSITDFEFVKNRISELKRAVGIPESECPPIYLVHANLSQDEMADLYNHPKIKAFITLTHGEGFGIPVLEAAAVGLPILATNWSGHLDILKDGTFIPLEYEMKEIPDAVVWGDILIKGSRWAEVKEEDVKKRMEKITKSLSKPREWAADLAEKVKKFDTRVTNSFFVESIKHTLLKQATSEINPIEHLQSFLDTPENYNVIYTMPMSTGDVYISTAVIDGLMKELPEDSKIYFATDPKYFDILKGNKNIHKCIPWNQSMLNIDVLEEVFDLALTPNINTQYLFSNWVRRGQGRLLAEEFANHCNVQLGDYFIEQDHKGAFDLLGDLCSYPVNDPDGGYSVQDYVTFHPGSGKGQWEGRGYRDWKEMFHNLKKLFPTLKVVQVGMVDEPLLEQTDLDLRGKTTPQQLAFIVANARLHIGIDSFTMHLAASLGTPLVAIFGCSYAAATGPWVKNPEKAKFALLQSERLSGCKNKACYKNRCKDNPHDGAAPINEIDPREILQACAKILLSKNTEDENE